MSLSPDLDGACARYASELGNSNRGDESTIPRRARRTTGRPAGAARSPAAAARPRPAPCRALPSPASTRTSTVVGWSEKLTNPTKWPLRGCRRRQASTCGESGRQHRRLPRGVQRGQPRAGADERPEPAEDPALDGGRVVAAGRGGVVEVGPVHPAVVLGERGIVEVGRVVALRQLVAHVEQRHPAPAEGHGVQQHEPPDPGVERGGVAALPGLADPAQRRGRCRRCARRPSCGFSPNSAPRAKDSGKRPE